MDTWVPKTFEAREDAERWARRFDYARAYCGMEPLVVLVEDGVVRVSRNDKEGAAAAQQMGLF